MPKRTDRRVDGDPLRAGIYQLGIYTNGSVADGNLGVRFDLVNRKPGPAQGGSNAFVPLSGADLVDQFVGPFPKTSGPGSLLKAIVCCSAQNFLLSIRLVQTLQGDTVFGQPICDGYAVEVNRPTDAALWAGLQVGVAQPLGSTEYLITAIRFLFASGVPRAA
jgi:hypothetical protein